jgi:hypothetical protein
MKATVWLDGSEVEHTLLERWCPRTDRYLQDGPHAARVESFNLHSRGGYVEFTDEPLEVEAADEPVPSAPKDPDDIPF